MRLIPQHAIAGALAFFLLSPIFLSGCGRLAMQGNKSKSEGYPESLQIWSERMPQWEAVFRQSGSAWRGADANYSIPLSENRILWLFGDSWIDLQGDPGRAKSTMITNSLAIQMLDKGEPTTPTLFWCTKTDGMPVAPIEPLPRFGPGRLWPLDGLRIGNTLHVFCVHMIESEGGIGARAVGSVLLRITNPDREPSDWEMDQTPLPYFAASPNGNMYFGQACLREDDFIFIFGITEDWKRGMAGRSMILARVPIEDFVAGDVKDWEFLGENGWIHNPENCRHLFNELAAEYSVSWLPALRSFAAVYSRYGNSPEIHARFAPRPEGPWSQSVVLHTAQDERWSKQFFYYAGRAHPELARNPNELILTYATNSWEIADVVHDLRLYWPRFVRVTLERAN